MIIIEVDIRDLLFTFSSSIGAFNEKLRLHVFYSDNQSNLKELQAVGWPASRMILLSIRDSKSIQLKVHGKTI